MGGSQWIDHPAALVCGSGEYSSRGQEGATRSSLVECNRCIPLRFAEDVALSHRLAALLKNDDIRRISNGLEREALDVGTRVERAADDNYVLLG